jgi:hypothetical protein
LELPKISSSNPVHANMELAAETSGMAFANLFMRRAPSEEDGIGVRVPAVAAEEAKVIMATEAGEAAITNNKQRGVPKGRMSNTPGNIKRAGKASRHRRGSSLLMRR